MVTSERDAESERNNEADETAELSFPVVGIGASAGGLEAVSDLLASLPATTGMAFLLVQHLDPGHESLLAGILAKKTPLPVAEARDGMTIAPDHFYVIPPNTSLTLASGVLRLQDRQSAERPPTPIDTLLHSLAEQRGRFAIGVILSGGGSDGALGMREIKNAGGITFAQQPASARFATMPNSAIATGCVDFVLPPRSLADALAKIGSHAYLNSGSPPESDDEYHLRQVFQLLHSQCGVDFSHYKRSTVERRLARRMALRQTDGLAHYAEILQHDPAEVRALAQDMLIRVTAFFRDPETFEGLAETVFPALVNGRTEKEPLRIWVPGCASGEEVYSIAICLIEFLEAQSINIPMQIFGTDLSEAAIEIARAGEYVETIAGQMSAERLQRFFNKQDHHYEIVKSIRDLCVFARQDVTADPPFSRLDLVSCRNLLIYMAPPLQAQVIPRFHYALKPHCFLVLGPAETVGGGFTDLFELVDLHHRFYRRMAGAGRLGLGFNAVEPAVPARQRETTFALAPAATYVERVQRETERLLLARYAPACVLIDEGLNVIYFHGDTSRYLEHARGPASLNLQKLASQSLFIDLNAAVQTARKSDAPVRGESAPMEVTGEVAGEARKLHFEVIPLRVPQSNDHCYLIIFAQAAVSPHGWDQPAARRMWQAWANLFRFGGAAADASEKDEQILRLKRDLESTGDYLRSTIEAHEAAAEELKSANEEILSANEEFQSTNEELETAKEELQSTNEELTTTNDELRDRNRELNRLNDALTESRDHWHAIVETIRHPLLVLTSDLRAEKVNSAFYECFQTTPVETEHCLLYELGEGQWNIPRLRILLDEILSRDSQLRDYEMTHLFPRIGEKTMLLNARKIADGNGSTAKILLAIEDISERKQAALKLAEQETFLRTIIEADPNGIMLLDRNGVLQQMNRAGLDLLEAETFDDLAAKPFNEIIAAAHRQAFDELAAKVLSGDRGTIECEIIGLKGTPRWLATQVVPIRDRHGAVTALLGISQDISERRQHLEQLNHHATHDTLTGIVNRAEFERRLDRALASLAGGIEHVLLYLDLDQFKIINDTCGHAAGDELLRQIAQLMAHHVRARDTFARLGGDEFGVLLEHCSVAHASSVANGLLQALEDAHFTWESKSFTIGVSIGLVPIPEGGDTVQAVLRAADQACYAAKEKGRNRVHAYVPSDRDLAQRHREMQWVGRIQEALAMGRFQLYFQPIVPLRDGALSCDRGEILLRLRDANDQLVLPGAFIPAAERYQQMRAIDRWVVHAALPLLGARRAQNGGASYGINISGQSLDDEGFLEFVLAELGGNNLPPASLCFEITETALISNLNHARRFIFALRDRGCQFALDDFGTGLSSFSYLKTLPVDYLKIDGAFIKDILDDPIDDAMVRSMCQIGQAMGLKVIAESVETGPLLEHLKTINVDYVQGYAVAKPAPIQLVH